MHCILLAPPGEVVNQAMLDYWRPHVPVVSDPALVAALQPLASALPFNPLWLPVPGAGVQHKNRAHKLVQRAWEVRGRPPVLQLLHAHRRDGRARLSRFGITESDWFACLHVREAGYLAREHDDTEHFHRYRNADIATYLPAVQAVVERGGWVIRMGDPSMTPLSSMERVVDYALSDIRCDWMDMFLCAEGRFMLGSSSGLVMVAHAFGTPTVMTNMTPVSCTCFSGRDIFIPKLYRSIDSGHLLTLSESLRPPYRDLTRGDRLRDLGTEVIDNDPDDIRDATIEMLSRLDGALAYGLEDDALQSRIRSVFDETGNVLQGRMARDFLRRHAGALLADRSATEDPRT